MGRKKGRHIALVTKPRYQRRRRHAQWCSPGGSIPSPRNTPRDQVVDQLPSSPFTPRRPLTRAWLRNLERKRDDESYLITNKKQMDNLINLSIRAHRLQQPKCDGDLSLQYTERNLISNTMSMKCSACNFVSDPADLYRKVKPAKPVRGRKRSTLNLALGAGLVSSSIGAQQASELFLGLGILPGSTTGINNVCAAAADIVDDLAESSMADERGALEGREGRGVVVSSDCMYNNRLIGDPANPFQRGTQRVSTAIAHQGNGKYKALSVNFTSKLCNIAYRRMRRGLKPECPHHRGCTADVSQTTAIGGEDSDIAHHRKNLEHLRVSEVVTDGDTNVGEAIREFGEATTHMHDFRHVSRSLTRALNNVELSQGAFGEGKILKREKQSIQHKFSQDLTWRINAEVTSRTQKLSQEMDSEGDREAFCLRLEQSLVDIPRIIIQCVASECGSDCTENSDICIGGLNRKHKRNLMGVRKLYLTPRDKSSLRDIIVTKKTSFQALMASLPSCSTQINEATNRAILKYWPKNVTYTRTARARAKRFALDMNLGWSQARLAVGRAVQHQVSRSVEKKVKKMGMRRQYTLRKQALPAQKRSRRNKYLVLNEIHREKGGVGLDLYQKETELL